MARVPTYDNLKVEEAGIAAPQIANNPTAETFGGGAGKLVQGAGSFIAKIQDDADQVAVLDADRQLNNYISKRLYDKDTGSLNKKGKDAFPVKETTLEQLNMDASEIENKLSNPVQKAAFRRKYGERSVEVGRTLDRHVGAEIAEFDKTNTQAGLDNAYNMAISNYTEMGIVEKNFQDSQEMVRAYAERNGMGEAYIEEHTKVAGSKITLGVMRQMIDGDMYGDARQFYADNKEHLYGKDLQDAEKEIKVGTLKGESMEKSDAIFAKSKSRTEAMNEVKKIEEPELRDATSARVVGLYQQQEYAKREDEQDRYKTAFQIADQYKSLDKIPTKLLASLEPEHVKSIKNWISNPDGIAPNSKEYIDAKIMAANPETRRAFVDSNIYELQPKMSQSNFKEVLDLWIGIKNKTDDVTGKLDNMYSKDEIERTLLAAVDIDTTPKTSAGAQDLREFRVYMSKQVADRQKELGRELNNQELTDEINAAIVEGKTTKAWFWGDGGGAKRKYQLTGKEEQFIIPVEEIPRQDRVKFENYLRSKKLPVTDEALQDLYSRYARAKSGQ